MSSRPQPLPFHLDDSRLYPNIGSIPESRDSADSIFAWRYRPTSPRRPNYVLPFLQTGFDSSEPPIDLDQLLEDFSIEKQINAILERLVDLSTEAESFLRSDLEITSNLDKALQCLDDFLRNIGVRYSVACDFWQDSEAPFFEVLETIIKVDLPDYDKVLKLWKAADERIFESLSPTVREKIVVLFERL